jgi:cytochrome b561
MSATTGTLSRYDARTILLHWVTAVLVILSWVTAQVIDLFPRGAPRVNAMSVHITLGVVLALVLAYRLTWRTLYGARVAPLGHPALAAVATWVHRLLYVLLVIEVLLGFANAWARGASLFNLFAIPSFAPGDRALIRRINGIHELVANTILVVAGLHALAALVHYYVWKDEVLRRMLPRRAP